MVLRRDLRTLLGLAAGFALQALAVAALVGPGVWLNYVHALPAISAITRHAHYSPLMEASLTGMASNVLWAAGLTAWEAAAMKITYAVTVSAAAVMLCRVVWAGSREQGAGSRERGAGSREQDEPRAFPLPGLAGNAPSPHPDAAPALLPAPRSPLPAPRSPLPANYEYACGVLFMMMVPPYFILYDQTLLAIPLVMLWSSPAWRWGVALYATATVLVVNFSLVLGFGLTAFVALATMFFLSRSFDFLKNRPRFQMEDGIAFRDTNKT